MIPEHKLTELQRIGAIEGFDDTYVLIKFGISGNEGVTKVHMMNNSLLIRKYLWDWFKGRNLGLLPLVDACIAVGGGNA